MEPVRKKIITDEAHHSIAVQIDYADWERIEPILREHGLLPPAPELDEAFEALLEKTRGIWPEGESPSLDALADAARPYWKGGDGLDYQLKIRDEWEGRP